MNEWKASGGRITLFPSAPASSPPLSALELYRQVWGEDPDGFQKQANPLMPAVAHGKRGRMTASCSTHPTRIDFNLTPPSPSQNVAQVSLPLIEDAGQFHSELLGIVDAIREGAVSARVARVALSVQFLILKPSFADANRALATTIPDQYGVRITNEEDFIFQINQPYTSHMVDDIKMNSIRKWSVERHQLLTFLFSLGAAPTPVSVDRTSAKPQIEEFIAGSVTFDNNNVPKENPFSGEQQSSLLLEALAAVEEVQRSIGLNVEGFRNAKLPR
jgi:hypothetical protein